MAVQNMVLPGPFAFSGNSTLMNRLIPASVTVIIFFLPSEENRSGTRLSAVCFGDVFTNEILQSTQGAKAWSANYWRERADFQFASTDFGSKQELVILLPFLLVITPVSFLEVFRLLNADMSSRRKGAEKTLIFFPLIFQPQSGRSHQGVSQ